MRFIARTGSDRHPLVVPTLGRLAVHNALAAVAVGLAAGCRMDEVAAGLAAGWSAPHRMQLLRAGGVHVLDDSYNASPGSVTAALDVLAGLPGRRVAVLGEMRELGDAHDAGHRLVGKAAAGIVELLVVVGSGARLIEDGARAAGLEPRAICRVESREEALDALRPRLREGDVVLVKASRGVELDLLVDSLVAERDPSSGGGAR
jgi:UDP-N-acetylmuramoyl-tripeptide--D-alanyl-D-alanine ligase